MKFRKKALLKVIWIAFMFINGSGGQDWNYSGYVSRQKRTSKEALENHLFKKVATEFLRHDPNLLDRYETQMPQTTAILFGNMSPSLSNLLLLPTDVRNMKTIHLHLNSLKDLQNSIKQRKRKKQRHSLGKYVKAAISAYPGSGWNQTFLTVKKMKLYDQPCFVSNLKTQHISRRSPHLLTAIQVFNPGTSTIPKSSSPKTDGLIPCFLSSVYSQDHHNKYQPALRKNLMRRLINKNKGLQPTARRSAVQTRPITTAKEPTTEIISSAFKESERSNRSGYEVTEKFEDIPPENPFLFEPYLVKNEPVTGKVVTENNLLDSSTIKLSANDLVSTSTQLPKYSPEYEATCPTCTEKNLTLSDGTREFNEPLDPYRAGENSEVNENLFRESTSNNPIILLSQSIKSPDGVNLSDFHSSNDKSKVETFVTMGSDLPSLGPSQGTDAPNGPYRADEERTVNAKVSESNNGEKVLPFPQNTKTSNESNIYDAHRSYGETVTEEVISPNSDNSSTIPTNFRDLLSTSSKSSNYSQVKTENIEDEDEKMINNKNYPQSQIILPETSTVLHELKKIPSSVRDVSTITESSEDKGDESVIEGSAMKNVVDEGDELVNEETTISEDLANTVTETATDLSTTDKRRSDLPVDTSDGDEVRFSREDLLQIVPIIVERLKESKLPLDDEKLWSEAYGKVWPSVLELSRTENLDIKKLLMDPNAVAEALKPKDPIESILERQKRGTGDVSRLLKAKLNDRQTRHRHRRHLLSYASLKSQDSNFSTIFKNLGPMERTSQRQQGAFTKEVNHRNRSKRTSTGTNEVKNILSRRRGISRPPGNILSKRSLLGYYAGLRAGNERLANRSRRSDVQRPVSSADYYEVLSDYMNTDTFAMDYAYEDEEPTPYRPEVLELLRLNKAHKDKKIQKI